MDIRCLTNNPMVIDNGCAHIEAIEGDTLAVLKAAKDEIIKGYKLITHPLTGSIRPDISPYKTIVITKMPGKLDIESLNIIENAIDYTESLYSNINNQKWDIQSIRDFQLIDFDLIKEFIQHEQ